MKSFVFTLISFAFILNTEAQTDSVTAGDYANAESMLSFNTQKYIDHGSVRPNWLPGDRFWFRDLNAKGSEFILVDPANGKLNAAFDQQKLAASLSTATGKKYEAEMLPFQTFRFSPDGKTIFFDVNKRPWKCNLATYECTQVIGSAANLNSRDERNDVLSPDGKKAAFIKDYNLWVRDVASGKETQLTEDGVQYFGYATDNAGWKQSDKPILRWSPDSRKIATFQQDERKVGFMYLVSTNVGHPKLKSWKYALPGDSNIVTIQRVIINVDTPKVIRLQIPPDPHRGTLSDDISSSGTFDDVDWNPNDLELAFVSTSRDHKQEKFRIANAVTGEVREVFEETVPTQFESGQGALNWRYLPKTNEIIWYSERDNYGHLYLYDATTGKLKNKITDGDYVITKLLKVDERNRILFFDADGLDKKNPYFTHLYKIAFDGKHFTSLSPEEGNHSISCSPTEEYFIDSYSQPDVPAVMVLRNINGKLIS